MGCPNCNSILLIGGEVVGWNVSPNCIASLPNEDNEMEPYDCGAPLRIIGSDKHEFVVAKLLESLVG